MTVIFKGHSIAERLIASTRHRSEGLGRRPLCVTLYDPANAPAKAYLTRQQTLAEAAGITLLPEAWGESGVLDRLCALSQDPSVDAVIPLLPLPAGISPLEAALAIGAAKEVDGQHPLHAGAVLLGDLTARAPATAMAAFLCAKEILGDLKGAEITLIGASTLIGRPLVALLAQAESTVTLCQKATRDLAPHCRGADLVISAAGVPGLLGRAEIAPGGRVLDLAIIRAEGELRGDADQGALIGHAALLSHVPDGVGPVTTACLFANIMAAACGAPPDFAL